MLLTISEDVPLAVSDRRLQWNRVAGSIHPPGIHTGGGGGGGGGGERGDFPPPFENFPPLLNQHKY